MRKQTSRSVSLARFSGAARLATVIVTGAGLIVLYLGLADAVSLINWGDPNQDREHGLGLAWLGAALLAVSAFAVAARGGRLSAGLVALPGIVSLTLLYAYPDSAYVLLTLLILAPVAFAASIAGGNVRPIADSRP